jgi:two-component system sensor histidine kinase KdpD
MTNDADNRPSPEALLKRAREEEAAEGKGKLKIFLGYAAGVGKTYAMLEAARLRKRDGRDVAVGYVESHGRPETDALLEGLEIISPARIDYQGVVLEELDMDAVLARRPQIVLVDELAHTNAPGCRHEKRWQDLEELLADGIDVYTTVNVQHFESLNDVIAQITGIVVRETVPDSLLDRADEIRLVDISPDDLLQRLREGKVYIPELAAHAMETFFRPGNLLALRELSMRRAASRVDDQMRAYMETRSIAGPWSTAERVLVAVSGSPYSERLIRSARRLADELKAPWYTVYIETPDGSKFASQNRERIWRDMRLAESLGSQVISLTAASVPDVLIEYAVRHNITKIVIGKPTRPRWREFLRTPIVDDIIRRSGPIDVCVVSFTPAEEAKKPVKSHRERKRPHIPSYAMSLLLVVAATMICAAVSPILDPTNLVMIYLLAVVLAATRLELKPALLTVVAGVLAFDFFFVPPRLTLAVADTQYLVTFVALFTVGVVISTLVARARERAEILRIREVQTASLYYLSRDLASAGDCAAVLTAAVRNMEESLTATLVILLSEGERLEQLAASEGVTLSQKEQAVADWAFRNRHAAGRGTDTLGSAERLYLPLESSANVLGVVGVRLEQEEDYRSEQVRRLLDSFATQTATALERVQFARQAQQAQILQARENLERALLNSISHDLRTPIASITGILSSLKDEGVHISEKARGELMDTAAEEAVRLNRFVGNLLDMTRIEAGAVRLNSGPCDVQDLVGCALAALEPRVSTREVKLKLPPDMPLVQMDMVLMTQVLVNLLDNCLKYSPDGSPIEISAWIDGSRLFLKVSDRGPGVPEQDLKRIFDKFYRIPVPEGAGGTGLGLSICKGIVEAHGGTVTAGDRPGGGLQVTVRLPLNPPQEAQEV